MLLSGQQTPSGCLGRRVIGPSQQDSGSYIAAPQGPLPLGPHTWRCWDGEQFVDQTATVTLLSQAEVAAAEQRSLAAHSAATMSKKNQVRAQLAGVRAVVVAGSPRRHYNGSYAPRPAHQGWPRFENRHGETPPLARCRAAFP